MKRREFLRRAGLLAGVTLFGGLTQGCGSWVGHETNDDADLKITNHSPYDIHVYVDGSHIGDVNAFDSNQFHVLSGTRTVEVREHGGSIYYDLGDHYFGWDKVRLHYYG